MLALLLPWAATAAITVEVLPPTTGVTIPADFSGLSFEMQTVLAGQDGGHFFSPTNRVLVDTFRGLGIKSLRVGGNTADRPGLAIPDEADVDSLFAFARAADVKVLFTLRLREGKPEDAARLANYLTRHYADQLEGVAIGNEPNVFNKQFTNYLTDWRTFAADITADTNSPGLKFCGPGVSPGHETWSAAFAENLGASGQVAFVTQHDYPGGDARRATNAPAARAKILSAGMEEHYAKFASHFLPAIARHGLTCRLEEANSFYDGGAPDVSDTYAAALWALDYQWWWAAHGIRGINFHTGNKVAARDENKPCRYAVFWTGATGCDVHPIGYAIKLFSLAEPAQILDTRTENADQLNVTVYAATDRQQHLCLTLINRENGSAGRPAEFFLKPGITGTAEIMTLQAPGNDVAAKTGLTLGGASLQANAEWHGHWMPLPATGEGRWSITLPPTSAAVIQFTHE